MTSGSWRYDASGNLTDAVQTAGTGSLHYDYDSARLNELTQVSNFGQPLASFTYDANGDPLSITAPTGADFAASQQA